MSLLKNKAATFIPVAIETTLDLPPLWGRFSRLSPLEAEIASQFELPAGRTVVLNFELGRGEFRGIRAVIKTALRDDDGCFAYSLVFLDPAQSGLLRSAIIAGLEDAAR